MPSETQTLVDDPTQDRPRFDIYKTSQGLSSNDIGAITDQVEVQASSS